MAEFYTWSWQARLLITSLLALCVLAQSLAVILSVYALKRRYRALPELCVLALIVFCSMLYGQIANGIGIGLAAPVGYGAPRLPMEGRAWAWGYLAVLLFLLTRSIYLSLRRYREIRTGISTLSVKDAIDSLCTGILFSEPDGFILLSNTQMQKLMTVTTGMVQHNSLDFYGLLAREPLRPGCRKVSFEGQTVCLLPDSSAWMFTQAELRIGRKTYLQLTASDVTDQWALTSQMQRQNEQLERRNKKLKETIANLHILSREQETQKVKMRAHDILGQRLSLLLRTVRDAREADYGLLRSLSEGLLDELKAEGKFSAQKFLDNLRQEFELIDVDIRLEGPLPEDCAMGELFADIVREGATNAVRHGLATQVLIQIDHSQDICHMRIANNGPPPPEKIKEGDGLGSIRKKVEVQGGALRVVTHPHFVLEIDMPGHRPEEGQ